MIEHIVLHRISPPNYPATFPGVVAFFEEVMKWRHPAYHIVIDTNGHPHQWQSLDGPTNHAGPRWRSNCISIAHIGDFRTQRPSQIIWDASIGIVSNLRWCESLPVSAVLSHQELVKDEKVWRCPGKFWGMKRYREELSGIEPLGDVVSPVDRRKLMGWV